MSRDLTRCRGKEDVTSAVAAVCDGVLQPSGENNFCMRDDSFTVDGAERLWLFPTGCPDHQIGNDEDQAAKDASGRWLAQFQRYRIAIPMDPAIGEAEAGGEAAGDVLGVLVNGVPFVHHKSLLPSSSVDGCGGSIDSWHRYRYEELPVCLLESMGVTPSRNVSEWPPVYAPSPLIGYALDGFPIFGPYDATGVLAQTGPCGFVADRYHVTAADGLPQCTVGDHFGLVESAVLSRRCPLAGLETAYCADGAMCVLEPPEPLKACEKDRNKNALMPVWPLVALFILLLLYVAICSRKTISYFVHMHMSPRVATMLCPTPRGPRAQLSPGAVSVLSVLVSLLLVALQDEVVRLFYQRNSDKKDKYVNDALGAFLSIVGVLYALVVAQVLGTAYERRATIRACLSEELAAIHALAMLVASLDAVSRDAKDKKRAVFDILDGYVVALVGQINDHHASEPGDFSLLFAVVPLVHDALDACVHTSAHDDIASRTADAANDVARQRYQRSANERKGLGTLFYVLNIFLSNAMFLGVLLIFSGSRPLNFTYCTITVISIFLTTYMVASLDDPYSGIFKIDLSDADLLLEILADLRKPHRMVRGLEPDITRAMSIAKLFHMGTSEDIEDELQLCQDDDEEDDGPRIKPVSYRLQLERRMITRRNSANAWKKFRFSLSSDPKSAANLNRTDR